jgi:DNA invertase Pin-like site-specific DNA recombinase
MQIIGYVRRSTDKQEMSLDQQRAKLEEFAASKGWKLVQVFSDDALSGSDMKRPGLDAMMQFARQSTDIHAVIAWERNRLARPKDPMDGMILERDLLASGKKVVYVATGQEAGTSFASGLISYVEHHQSGDYLRKLSRDTMRGHIHRAERGLWSGGPIPFGYDRLILSADGSPRRIVRDLPDRSQQVIDVKTGDTVEHVNDGHRYSKQDFELCSLTPSDPIRVQGVQKMFADYAAGFPIRSLRDDLNRCGIRTGRGRTFTAATIHAMLGNQSYVGDCVYNKRTESKWHRHTSAGSIERQDEGLEDRPQADWIIKSDAWPALIDRETFAKVQQRRNESREKHCHVSGPAIRSEYILTHVAVCGVCGSRLTGQTTTSGKGYRTRYYICSCHHRGDHELCPKRYKVPAILLEDHIIGLIKDDLGRLRDGDKLHQYIAEEMRRIRGSQCNAREQLQRRLAELDQAVAKLRDHLKALDPVTAAGLGMYDEARALMEERVTVGKDLGELPPALPSLPAAAELRRNADRAFDELDKVLAGGTIEQRRELIGLYVQKIKADPDTNSVQISLFPALFSRVVAGGGFEPPTSGL